MHACHTPWGYERVYWKLACEVIPPLTVTVKWGSRRRQCRGLNHKNDDCLEAGVKYQPLNQVKAWVTAASCH